MFNTGDSVIIVNPGSLYSSYRDWVLENVPEKLHKKWRAESLPYRSFHKTGIIVAKGPHGRLKEGTLYAVQSGNRIWVLNESG